MTEVHRGTSGKSEPGNGVRAWLPAAESGFVIFDREAGFRRFLGADPISAARVGSFCTMQAALTESLVTGQAVEGLSTFRIPLGYGFKGHQRLLEPAGVQVDLSPAQVHPFLIGRIPFGQPVEDFQSLVELTLSYDVRGRLVREFTTTVPGQVFWDGRDRDGVMVRPGVYFLRFDGVGGLQVRKLLLTR